MRIYMITITDNPISQHYKNLVLPSWTDRGYEVVEFGAITPQDLPYLENLNFAERKESKGNKKFTDTEKAVWYSHYILWLMCVYLQEPIHIIEHDTLLFDELPDFSDEQIALFAFYQEGVSNYKGVPDVVAPCAGYYITPEAAQKLIDKAVNSTILLNVDWTVHETFEDYHSETQRNIVLFQKYISPVCVARQVVDTQIGTTIVHNK